ncbi:hypothetical protein ACFQZT_32750 [Paenibacillus sp. GCM10027628]|uniref:hypothetical protein n=1 Tax=Paenibacillus sp. GCM10027628 TaxID=3273413 RepID=UPI00362EEC32
MGAFSYAFSPKRSIIDACGTASWRGRVDVVPQLSQQVAKPRASPAVARPSLFSLTPRNPQASEQNASLMTWY